MSDCYHDPMSVNWQAYGNRFRRLVIADPRVSEFLRARQFPSAVEGPCRMVAEGLRRALGRGELVACCVWCGARRQWTATHVALRINRKTLLDANGAHTPEELKDLTWSDGWFRQSGYHNPAWSLRSWDEDFARPLSWCESGVELFAELAAKALNK